MIRPRRIVAVLFAVLTCVLTIQAQQPTQISQPFPLQDGDTVVFYGDSITEQKLYTSDIENYVLTRFPDRHIRFIHSGVGGDTVSGGWTGPVDLRLARDIFAYQPAMVTVMLGMNDGYYRALDPGIESTYQNGYRHIVEQVQARLPQAKLTLLKPSPYDDVTRAPLFEPGYNATMLRFGDFVGKLAEEKHTLLSDLNRPGVDALTTAKAADAPLSVTLIRDRVHPGTGIHWLMAEAVLRTWNAPMIVTSVDIDVTQLKITDTTSTEVTQLHRTKNGLTWTQKDGALPLPFPSLDTDPFLALVLHISDLNQNLNQENLRIRGLAEGQYELQIDDRTVQRFTSAQLAAGVNLATLETPMIAQSRLVAMDTEQKNEIESTRFNLSYGAYDLKLEDTVKRLDFAIGLAIEHQRSDSKPTPHNYSLIRASKGTK